MNALIDIVDNLKISALQHAAKISPLVKERTIGRDELKLNCRKIDNSIERNENSNPHALIVNNCVNGSKYYNKSQNGSSFDASKFRKDVWREVNIDDERAESKGNNFHLNDCKLISFRMAANSAEKQRRAKILAELQEKQNKWDSDLEQRMQQIRIDSAEKQHVIQAKRLERDRIVLEAMQKLEAQAQQDELKSNLKKNEMNEHSRKVKEHADLLKRQDEMRVLFDNIMAKKILFINLFELFAKTVISHEAILRQYDKSKEYQDKKDALLKRYEKIMEVINSKQITIVETDLFEKLCEDVKQEQNTLSELIQTLKQQQAVDATNANNVKSQPNIDLAPTTVANEVSVTDGASPQIALANVSTSTSNAVNADRAAYYNELMRFCEEQNVQLKPITDDESMKKFRFNCKKAVTTPVNAITAPTPKHLLVQKNIPIFFHFAAHSFLLNK